ncbi:hypothetical protein T4D_8606 [Trichinella pseudospiralis]|uniref:Uncharacterized protein n=1 Tax=Trichinella pseudospiralis TaxID=6337 RepID=A0A0V1FYQ4_TRIPS|nr:hypothetical protein T4D_8606 [Trichinella pseudospiralis]
MFIPLKSKMSLRAEFCRLRLLPGEPVDAFAIIVQEIWMTELQILDRFREETNSWAVLIAMLKKEPTTMDEAWRIAWKLRKHPLAWTSDITFPMTDEWRNYQSPVSSHLLTGQSSTSSR